MLAMASASASSSAPPAQPPQDDAPRQVVTKDSLRDGSTRNDDSAFSKRRVGEGDNITLDREKLARAVKEERKRKARADEEDEGLGSRKKRPPTGLEDSHNVTEEELGMKNYFTLIPFYLLTRPYRGIPNDTESGYG